LPEAQAHSLRPWSAPEGPLGELTVRSLIRARESALARAELEAIVADLAPSPDLAAALRGEQVAVIAELKRRSPSKGALNESLDAGTRAAEYAAGGAAALSILTEPSRFGGSLSDLRDARRAVELPVLRKDFITDAVQLLEARAFGASGVLLIARALAPSALRALATAAVEMGLTPLIEVRDERELAEAVAVERAVIGVNNRNLETLEIDARVGARLIPLIPGARVAVYESGVSTVEDLRAAAATGADAVLVGSVLSAAPDGAAAVRALTQQARQPRG
jgi:indole-3-glycerol phosphate synthase